MTFCGMTIINLIFITFPILLWLLIMTYNKNIAKKENELFLDFAIFTILYLIIRFSPAIMSTNILLIVNIPLIMAYIKRRQLSSITISILLIVYYNYYFSINIWWLILEYIVYYGFYTIYKDQKNYVTIFSITFVTLKSTLYSTYFLAAGNYIEFQQLIYAISMLYLGTYLILQLIKRGEEILKYHLTLKELEQQKQIRDSLFKITHEIKNPIAVCKGYLDMFDVNNINHSKKYIPILREEVERTLILLQDFLCMTKIQINKELIDINMVLEDVTDNFIPILKERNITEKFNIVEKNVYMYGDYNRLTQAFINIIKNSVEAFDSSKKNYIKLYTELSDKDITIYVIDNGVGISKENLKKINEPFFTTKCRGTGLGVSLSYEIILAHNGSIKYESEEGNGTTVTITLPIVKEKGLS